MEPTLIIDRMGQSRATLSEVLQPAGITALVGGGGKTSTMLTLAKEHAALGRSVSITTTTRIYPVTEPMPDNIKVYGVLGEDGKLHPLSCPDALKQDCDLLLIEADGSRGLPAKVPAEHEPVLTPQTELVVAVFGLTSIGQPIASVCHRVKQVCGVLSMDETARLTVDDAVKLISCTGGLRKNVGQRRFAVVLNQADTPELRQYGQEIMQKLGNITSIMTCYRKGAIQ